LEFLVAKNLKFAKIGRMSMGTQGGFGSEGQTKETYAGYGGKSEDDGSKTTNSKPKKEVEKKGDIAELQK